MKRYLKCIGVYGIIFLWRCCLSAQPNIKSVEYYIDKDPGYGNATPINITPATDLSNLTADVRIDTLSIGAHVFGIRAKDSNEAWSLDNKWLFIKQASAVIVTNIIEAEYYIDNDPGYGKATAINITPGTDLLNLTADIRLDTLSDGAHVVGIRAKDFNEAWSLDNKWLFVKQASAVTVTNIIEAEYYIDNDPGYGKATAINITLGADLSNLPADIRLDTLSAGVHVVGIRAKDFNEAWSLDNKWLFVKEVMPPTIPDAIQIEYYVDIDPGYGKASQVNIKPGINFPDSIARINPDTLSIGVHVFGIRAKDSNGAWSLDNKWQFVVNRTLPIVLTRLTGRYINNANELTAEIQQAINVKVIEVERSVDGIHFLQIGNLAGAPVNSGMYKYIDNSPGAGNNFYRLRIADNDGSISHSYVIVLNHSSAFTAQMYPNPVQDNLTVHFENAARGIYEIHVTDIIGKNIFSHKVSILQNGQAGDVNISFSQYAAGTYFIQVKDRLNNIVTNQKIIKDQSR